jgi:hypothetical protein
MRRLLKRIGLFLVLFMSIRYAMTTPGVLHTLGTGASLLAHKAEGSVPHAAQPASTSDANSSISGKPTISAQHIDIILAAYHSPATGLGQDIFNLGVQYSIDPIHVLAIFLHESSMGTSGEATKTMSPGNERCIKDRPCVDRDRGGYAQMESWQDGFAHLFSLLYDGYIKGHVSSQCPCTTISQIVAVFAPSADGNDVQDYIQAWVHAVQTWRSREVMA